MNIKIKREISIKFIQTFSGLEVFEFKQLLYVQKRWDKTIFGLKGDDYLQTLVFVIITVVIIQLLFTVQLTGILVFDLILT